ncbi:MAG: hypothetical protein A2Y15_07845 [Clostridiales bacterium GWF2_36_10]|nr:MAG: hypothetical protein A2Y15_07845 [Clostridiales bacterium GWF2_36_10]HAN22142.1 hypothetical protein [Clostridiales bacterium]
MDLTVIKKIAYEQMANKRSHVWKENGNKYYHGERVAKLVLELRKIIFPEDESHDDILTVAAWFHDIKNGIKNHESEGAELTKELLKSHCNMFELNEIYNIISSHDDRISSRELFNNYIKLHQDADHLDHFGTFDIWTIFLYAAPHDENMKEVINWMVNERPSENERYRKEINFEVSKEIFNDKAGFLKDFTDRFAVEGTGGVWNKEKFIKT